MSSQDQKASNSPKSSKASTGLLQQTDPQRRNYAVAALVGLIGGIVSAIVKFGWEVPLPPRTPERNSTNPPQSLLELFGLSPDMTHASYTFNGNEGLPWMSFIIHFAFAIVFAVFYCVTAERFPKIKLWQGMAFGIVIWVVFHVVLMPALGVVPMPWHQPWQEHFSEIPGHMIWMWVIEIIRRDLRNRITHQPDPEVLAV
ncbi:MAG: YagU family protein [Actinomycetaceae bacterium]|nr:YagU family protein [Actinomycetaceae bacterium]